MNRILSSSVNGFCPVVPSEDIPRSLKFWVDGLGFQVEDSISEDGVMVWCILSAGPIRIQLNQRSGDPAKPRDYEGIRMYWNPNEIGELQEHLMLLGFSVSEIVDREYGMREFFVDDEDGFNHCFGVPLPAGQN